MIILFRERRLQRYTRRRLEALDLVRRHLADHQDSTQDFISYKTGLSIKRVRVSLTIMVGTGHATWYRGLLGAGTYNITDDGLFALERIPVEQK